MSEVEELRAELARLRAEVKRLSTKPAEADDMAVIWSPSILEFTLDDDIGGPDDRTCAVIAEAVGAAMYGGSGKAARLVPDTPGAYACRPGRSGCRMYTLAKFYHLATDFPMPPWVAPWLVSRFRAQIHKEEESEW